jgi:hypothetical protein
MPSCRCEDPTAAVAAVAAAAEGTNFDAHDMHRLRWLCGLPTFEELSALRALHVATPFTAACGVVLLLLHIIYNI